MKKRALKNQLYEQMARMGKAVCSPRRLELLDLLAQGEKPVEMLARELGIDMRLASAHLSTSNAKEARLATPEPSRFISEQLDNAVVSDTALWLVAALTVSSGLVAPVRMSETLSLGKPPT